MAWNETSGNNFAALAGSLGSNVTSLTNGIQQGASGLAGAIMDKQNQDFNNNLKLWEYEDKRDRERQDDLANADALGATVDAASLTPDEINAAKDQGISPYEMLMVKHPMAMLSMNGGTRKSTGNPLADLINASATSSANTQISTILDQKVKEAEAKSKDDLEQLTSDLYDHSDDEIRSIKGYANLSKNEISKLKSEAFLKNYTDYIGNNNTNGILDGDNSNAMATSRDALKGLKDRLTSSGLHVDQNALVGLMNGDSDASKQIRQQINSNFIQLLHNNEKNIAKTVNQDPTLSPKDALRKAVIDSIGDPGYMSPEQWQIFNQQTAELDAKVQSDQNNPNSEYNRAMHNVDASLSQFYNTKVNTETDSYKRNLGKLYDASSERIADGTDTQLYLAHKKFFVDLMGVGNKVSGVEDTDSTLINQVLSNLTGSTINVADKAGGDAYTAGLAIIQACYGGDPMMLQKATNLFQNYKTYGSDKNFEKDIEAVQEYRHSNSARFSAVDMQAHRFQDNFPKASLLGQAHLNTLAEIDFSHKKELSQASNVAAAGSISGSDAKQILEDLAKNRDKVSEFSRKEMDAAISKAYADLNISELKPQDNADSSSSVEGVNSRYLTPKTADSVTYGADGDILSNPVLGPVADWVGNNGKDDGSEGFSKLGMGVGGILGGLEGWSRSSGGSGNWFSRKWGKGKKAAIGSLIGSLVGSYGSEFIPDWVPGASGSKKIQYAVNTIQTMINRGYPPEEIKKAIAKALSENPDSTKIHDLAIQYDIFAGNK